MFGLSGLDMHHGSAMMDPQFNPRRGKKRHTLIAWRTNRPNNGGKTTPTMHGCNDVAPNYKPENLTRQQLRQMLRKKAQKDIIQQYGRMAASGEQRFVGFLGFDRRGRRRAQHKIARKWYVDIATKLSENNEPKKPRGFVKDIMRRMFGGRENTLAASGVNS
jgi:hypothetical protein